MMDGGMCLVTSTQRHRSFFVVVKNCVFVEWLTDAPVLIKDTQLRVSISVPITYFSVKFYMHPLKSHPRVWASDSEALVFPLCNLAVICCRASRVIFQINDRCSVCVKKGEHTCLVRKGDFLPSVNPALSSLFVMHHTPCLCWGWLHVWPRSNDFIYLL